MSQTTTALLRLRDLILSGELAAGDRVAEVSLAARLSVSRTPIRAALARLQEEGLLEPLANGGYAVRSFSPQEVREAVEVRGTLEGLAARLAAEKGARPAELSALRELLAAINQVVSRPEITVADFERYVELNDAFHRRLVALADSPLLERQIARAVALPFASPSGFVMAQATRPDAHRILLIAQDQHHCILDAIEAREGARAEALLREHARLAQRNLQLAEAHDGAWDHVAGATLIERRVQ